MALSDATTAAAHHQAAETTIRLSEVLSSLSYALDLTEGQRAGNSARTCLVALRLAARIGLPSSERTDLLYAALLKDAGCSSNASHVCALFANDDRVTKDAFARLDWARLDRLVGYALRAVAPGASLAGRAWRLLALGLGGRAEATRIFALRCDRGAQIMTDLGFSPAASAAVRHLDEHWDGRGQPQGLRGEAIPLLARILTLAQTVVSFMDTWDAATALDVVRSRRGRWFDPALADEVLRWRGDTAFWRTLADSDPHSQVAGLEAPDQVLGADAERLDRIAAAFAEIIDAKSPFTFTHSSSVTAVAGGIAARLGVPADERRALRRAALLHDIGKLGVSNLILDKPGRLTDAEMAVMRRHPAHTEEILRRVPAFRSVAAVAAAHHERLDGSGYHRGVGSEALSLEARILAVADVYDALTADRPYRQAMPVDQAMAIIRSDAGRRLDPDAVRALASLPPAGSG